MLKCRSSFGKICILYIQTAVICLDNKCISHISSNICSMRKIGESPTTDYIYILARTEVYMFELFQVSTVALFNLHFIFLLQGLLRNIETKIISVLRVLEFRNSAVWENPFTALCIHCTTPGTAFKYLSDQVFLPQLSIALWKADLALSPHSQEPFMKWIPSISFLSQNFGFCACNVNITN